MDMQSVIDQYVNEFGPYLIHYSDSAYNKILTGGIKTRQQTRARSNWPESRYVSALDVVYLQHWREGMPTRHGVRVDIRDLDPTLFTADEDAIDLPSIIETHFRFSRTAAHKQTKALEMLTKLCPEWFMLTEDAFLLTDKCPFSMPLDESEWRWGRQTLGAWAKKHREVLSDPRLVMVSMFVWKTVAYRSMIAPELLIGHKESFAQAA